VAHQITCSVPCSSTIAGYETIANVLLLKEHPFLPPFMSNDGRFSRIPELWWKWWLIDKRVDVRMASTGYRALVGPLPWR
jgi:hypothetical protein